MVSTTLNDDELPPNNSDDDCIFSTTDLEEGIEIPIEIIGTSLVDVVVTSVDDEDDQYHLTALKKEKEPSLSPTKTVGTIESDDFELDDAISNEKTKKLSSFCCCTSSNNKRPLFITLAIIATLTAIIALSLSTSYLLLNSNNNKAVEEEQIQPSIVDDDVIIDNDGNDDGGGDKPLPKEDTSTTDGNTTAMTTTTSTTTTTTRPRDLFLLSGQSNMVGHTSSKQSIGGNGDYWNRIKSILEQGDDENLDTMEEKLYQVIYETNYYNDQVATTLTNGVMDLYKSSLLNDLDTPLTFGRCSFQEASDSQEVEDVSHGTVPISLNSNCGHSFGHESLFGRTLELDMNYTTIDFELHKVARGGSSLFEHWYPNHGQHWNLLKEAIEERRGQGVDWKGFIWHQGSQEAWSEEAYGEDRSRTFYGNLTGLVNEVRELMFQNSMTWRCKEEIPVVIVQVGSWPGNNAAAQRTRDAQAKFCNDDPRAVLVKTDDLSTFYHYDAASFLISGIRIAYAYQEALGGVVECPDRVPSSSPSDVAVSSLSSSSSVSSMPTVIRLEADLPPSSVISELV